MSERYVVKAVKFFCGDESGADWSGSDEPYWVFSAVDEKGKAQTKRSKEFGDVDSGETRSFPTNTVIWPANGASAGAAGPIAISIQLWEADGGDPDDTVRKTKRAFDIAGMAPGVGSWVRAIPSVVKDQLDNLISDDLMGSNTISYSVGRLARRLPRPGDRFVEKHHFGGNSGDLPFKIAGGPDYDLFIEVSRVA